MNRVTIFLISALTLFMGVGGIAYWKKGRASPASAAPQLPPIEVAIPAAAPKPAPAPQKAVVLKESAAPSAVQPAAASDVPFVDRISQLFALDSSKLPIVETVSYTSRVPWLKGRPAWIADYASYYETSRHFIARSLNRKVDYFTQKVSPGDRFNVFKKDKNISFHLLIDLSRCKMLFYYIDNDLNERVLLKTYTVGLGRLDASRASGSLTPVGKYLLGEKVAIYKPGTMGFFHDQKVEMVQVFGTRWIPFEQELEGCSEAAKGYGLHGAPWTLDSGGKLIEDRSKIGKYDSDGCVRLSSEDIEELFAIILTKPTVVEIVKDFKLAKVPGVEKP